MSLDAMKQALDALEHVHLTGDTQAFDLCYADHVIPALRAAIEKAERPRQWQGLTDEERKSIREWQRIQEELGPVWAPMMLYLHEAIEAKLKEKNG